MDGSISRFAYFYSTSYSIVNRIDRVTAILIQLQSKKVVKAQEIADRFSISLRTVYRDVKSLEEAGVPIIGEAGVGYSIMDGYKLPPVMFTKEEATAFITAEKLINKLTDKATAEQYKAALYKVKAVLRSTEKGFAEDIDDAIHVFKSRNHQHPAGNSNHIYDILQSISSKKAIQLYYYSGHRDQDTERVVEPVGIYYISNYWHMVAWCRLRNDYRNFRLDRINKIIHSDEVFRPRELTLKEYLAKWSAENKLEEVVISFDKSATKYIQQQKLYFGFSREQNKGNRVEITFLVPCLDYIASWLLSFGSQIRIISPLALREKMSERVAELAAHYNLKINEPLLT